MHWKIGTNIILNTTLTATTKAENNYRNNKIGVGRFMQVKKSPSFKFGFAQECR